MDHHDLSDGVSDRLKGWESPGGASSEESHAAAMESDNKKTCADCGTSKTPLWRSGPAGPKSLCNACGIRSRKRRRAILGMEEKKVKRSDPGSTSSIPDRHGGMDELKESLKRKLLAIGKHGVMPRSSVARRPRKKIGEEEEAAMLLMALSYGSVYA